MVNDGQPGLLPVVLQNLIAGRRDLGAILLEAGQNGEIALVDYRTAEALHVTGTGLLFVRGAAALLGEGIRRNRDRQQGECQEKFTHRIPSFSAATNPVPELRFGSAGADFLGWQAPRSAATNKGQALANAAKFTTPPALFITG
jgi:hypothetical protein